MVLPSACGFSAILKENGNMLIFHVTEFLVDINKSSMDFYALFDASSRYDYWNINISNFAKWPQKWPQTDLNESEIKSIVHIYFIAPPVLNFRPFHSTTSCSPDILNHSLEFSLFPRIKFQSVIKCLMFGRSLINVIASVRQWLGHLSSNLVEIEWKL